MSVKILYIKEGFSPPFFLLNLQKCCTILQMRLPRFIISPIMITFAETEPKPIRDTKHNETKQDSSDFCTDVPVFGPSCAEG